MTPRLKRPGLCGRIENGAPVVTDRQGDYLTAIAVRAAEGEPPYVFRELADVVGIGSSNAVMEALRGLRKKGLVEWVPDKSRTLRLTPLGEQVAAVISDIEGGEPTRSVS